MNHRQLFWKQLQTFEKRGDLQKQAEILVQALGPKLSHQALTETLKMAFERAQVDAVKNPPEVYRAVNEKSSLQMCNSRTGEVLRECVLPREAGLIPPGELNWSPQGAQQVMLFDVDNGKLNRLETVKELTSAQQGLCMNSSYSYLNLPGPRYQTSWFCRSFYFPGIPLETVKSLPLDLFISPRHPFLAVSDRGAGKLHLVQRENFRLLRSWPIVANPGKKALNVCFHPDGKRIFVSAHQAGLLVMIDRGMAQKKLPLPATHLIGALSVSNKGDLLYALALNPETRRPSLWVIDCEKFKQQQVIELDGEAFSTGADARDLFDLAPDGQYAVVMVSKNQPALFTPCLLLVELATGQIVDQMVLTPDQKPAQLAFTARELFNPRLRLLPILIHGGFGVSEDMVKEAFGVEKLV